MRGRAPAPDTLPVERAAPAPCPGPVSCCATLMIAFQKGDSHGGHSARSRFIATAREPGQEDIFWIGANGDVSTTWRNDGIDGGNWHQQVGIAFPSSVRPDAPLIATAREPGQMDVFWIGATF